jgi:hypothetical protein
VGGVKAVSFVGFLGGAIGSLATESILPLAIGLGGGVGIFCVGIPLAVQLYNQHKNRIENEDVASKAGRALIYAMPDTQAESEALNILQNPKTPDPIKQAIVEGLRKEVRQVAEPSSFIYALSNSDAHVREALLGALANNRGKQVEAAVHKCTNDSNTNVRRLAYEIVDSWKNGDKKKDSNGTASFRGCPPLPLYLKIRLLKVVEFRDSVETRQSRSTKLYPLSQRQFITIINGISLATHILAPGVRTRFTSAACIFFTAKRSTDFGARGTNINVGYTAITTNMTQKAFSLLQISGKNRRTQALRHIVINA